jgi:hypothetical protein
MMISFTVLRASGGHPRPCRGEIQQRPVLPIGDMETDGGSEISAACCTLPRGRDTKRAGLDRHLHLHHQKFPPHGGNTKPENHTRPLAPLTPLADGANRSIPPPHPFTFGRRSSDSGPSKNDQGAENCPAIRGVGQLDHLSKNGQTAGIATPHFVDFGRGSAPECVGETRKHRIRPIRMWPTLGGPAFLDADAPFKDPAHDAPSRPGSALRGPGPTRRVARRSADGLRHRLRMLLAPAPERDERVAPEARGYAAHAGRHGRRRSGAGRRRPRGGGPPLPARPRDEAPAGSAPDRHSGEHHSTTGRHSSSRPTTSFQARCACRGWWPTPGRTRWATGGWWKACKAPP